jgi:DNA ligase D-like protein (predicted 3'-phosphoesterase)
MARFLIQLHQATNLHYDLRLESAGVFRSWAVPKGPSLDPGVRRLAVQVPDHALADGHEGAREYGGRSHGAIVWDEGTVEFLRDEPAHVTFRLHGYKLNGRFALIRTDGTSWILVKGDDEHGRRGSDIVAEAPESTRSGMSWPELAEAARSDGPTPVMAALPQPSGPDDRSGPIAPPWPDNYPPAMTLRAEVTRFADAIADALLRTLPPGSIAAMYAQGSAVKGWDGPIDYVPELSDVNVHVRLRTPLEAQARAALADIELGLQRHRLVEEALPSPRQRLHVPRGQVTIVNDLENAADYVPSPARFIRMLHGAASSEQQPVVDADRVRTIDARGLVAAADETVIAKVAADTVEYPGRHAFLALRQLSWRVSPLASRLMSVLGESYDDAWGTNRTTLINKLAEQDEALAARLVDYYLAAWAGWRVSWEDGEAARTALSAAVDVLRRGRAIGQAALST